MAEKIKYRLSSTRDRGDNYGQYHLLCLVCAILPEAGGHIPMWKWNQQKESPAWAPNRISSRGRFPRIMEESMMKHEI